MTATARYIHITPHRTKCGAANLVHKWQVIKHYRYGTALNHIQWQWAHETHRNILGFLDDEGKRSE